jgi:dTMP kinase
MLRFIVVEGIDESGKTTQVRLLGRYLRETLGKKVRVFRDPGGTAIGERIRRLLLDHRQKGISYTTELFLYMASRAQLVSEKILPALDRGYVVLCDRYVYSSVVYQGIAGGLGITRVRQIGQVAIQGATPDLVFLLDVDPALAFKRHKRDYNRIEMRGLAFFRKARQGFLKLARKEPRIFRIIDASRGIQEVQAQIRGHVDEVVRRGYRAYPGKAEA